MASSSTVAQAQRIQDHTQLFVTACRTQADVRAAYHSSIPPITVVQEVLWLAQNKHTTTLQQAVPFLPAQHGFDTQFSILRDCLWQTRQLAALATLLRRTQAPFSIFFSAKFSADVQSVTSLSRLKTQRERYLSISQDPEFAKQDYAGVFQHHILQAFRRNQTEILARLLYVMSAFPCERRVLSAMRPRLMQYLLGTMTPQTVEYQEAVQRAVTFRLLRYLTEPEQVLLQDRGCTMHELSYLLLQMQNEEPVPLPIFDK